MRSLYVKFMNEDSCLRAESKFVFVLFESGMVSFFLFFFFFFFLRTNVCLFVFFLSFFLDATIQFYFIVVIHRHS
jgi:hypothetical protein